MSISRQNSLAQTSDSLVQNKLNIKYFDKISDSDDDKLSKKHISSVNDTKRTLVNDLAFVQVVKNDFSFLTTGNSNANLYNQIFVEAIEPKIQVNIEALEMFNRKKDKSLATPAIRLNLGINAGIKNNIGALFSNDKINPDVGISGQLNFDLARIFNRPYGYYFLEKDRKSFMKKDYNFKNNLKIERSIIQRKKDLNIKEIDFLDKKIKQIDQTIGQYPDTRDSLSIERIKLEIQRNQQQLKSDTLVQELENFDESIDEVKASFYNKSPFSSKRFYWLTFSGKLNGSEYKIYDESKVFSERVFDQQFVSNNLGVIFNTYATSKVDWFFNYYFSIGYSKSTENNFSGLDPVDISSTELSFSNDSSVTRTLSQSIKAFRGKAAATKFNNWDFQFLKFLTKDKKFGLNLTYQIKSEIGTDKTYKNLGVGLVVIAQDTKIEKQKYNVELYVKFKDLDNTRGNAEVYKWSRRNEIGVRLGLPFGLVK